MLRRGGFDPRHAAEIARSALWTGLMLVMSEPGYGPSLTRASAPRSSGATGSGWPCCRRTAIPCLVEAAVPMTDCDDPDFHYRFGVDLFIAGVQAMAEQG